MNGDTIPTQGSAAVDQGVTPALAPSGVRPHALLLADPLVGAVIASGEASAHLAACGYRVRSRLVEMPDGARSACWWTQDLRGAKTSRTASASFSTFDACWLDAIVDMLASAPSLAPLRGMPSRPAAQSWDEPVQAWLRRCATVARQTYGLGASEGAAAVSRARRELAENMLVCLEMPAGLRIEAWDGWCAIEPGTLLERVAFVEREGNAPDEATQRMSVRVEFASTMTAVIAGVELIDETGAPVAALPR